MAAFSELADQKKDDLAGPGPQPAGAAPSGRRGVELRIFLTCLLVYFVHLSPYVVRELYLTMSIAERGTFRVDEYMGFHSDLFTIPGRGSFLGGNPGVSFLAAVPYWLALPVVDRVAPVRPHTEENIQYDEARRNRLAFYRLARQRGLDLRLGMAAMITAGFLMAPLTALSAVVMFRLFRRMEMPENTALWLALVYGLGTPVFFRAGTLSQNLMVALLGIFAFALIWRPRQAEPDTSSRSGRFLQSDSRRYFVAGILAGLAVASDYTGIVVLAALGLFGLLHARTRGAAGTLRLTLWMAAGAIGPGILLAAYQWICFGSPWLPAQFYMPKRIFAGYPSEHGFGWPTLEALWGLLFDPLYGLLVFAPVLALAMYHPALMRAGRSRVPRGVAVFCWLLFAALYVFCASIHFTTRHQWQDGVRYMVPAVPFLFVLLGDILARAPRWLAWLVGIAAVAETWALAMVRESPLESLQQVLQRGFQFPWLTTLSRASAQYFPPLGAPASAWSLLLPSGLLLAMCAGIWVIWRWPSRIRIRVYGG